MKYLCLLALCLGIAYAQDFDSLCASSTFTQHYIAPGLCAWKFAQLLQTPRQLFVDSTNQILVQEGGGITAMKDSNNDGTISSNERFTLVSELNPPLMHSLVLENGYLYAAGKGFIRRWAYTAGATSNLGPGNLVLKNIPFGGDFPIRFTIIFRSGVMYLSVPTDQDVLVSAGLAIIAACTLDYNNIPADGYEYSTTYCTPYATGVRDPLSFAFDGAGRLWVPDNAIDALNRTDIGGAAIAFSNPADTIYMASQGSFHGFPYCWTEYILPQFGQGAGTQWADPHFMNETSPYTDAWCRDPANVHKPELALPAHSVPLGIQWVSPSQLSAVGVTASQSGLLVASHGSFSGDGYSVAFWPFDSNNNPTGQSTLLLKFNKTALVLTPPAVAPYRPVSTAFGKVGDANVIFVTDDYSGTIIAIARGKSTSDAVTAFLSLSTVLIAALAFLL